MIGNDCFLLRILRLNEERKERDKELDQVTVTAVADSQLYFLS